MHSIGQLILLTYSVRFIRKSAALSVQLILVAPWPRRKGLAYGCNAQLLNLRIWPNAGKTTVCVPSVHHRKFAAVQWTNLQRRLYFPSLWMENSAGRIYMSVHCGGVTVSGSYSIKNHNGRGLVCRYVVAHVAVGLKAHRSVSVNMLCRSIVWTQISKLIIH